MLIDISRTLDETTAVFPGDVSFSRTVTMSRAQGDSCDVTAFTASAHAGTHVDLPKHFADRLPDPPLAAYVGPAVVIAVDDWPEVTRRSIRRGLRVLFKTRNSDADYREFDDAFSCISKDAVAWLIKSGAVLAGVDGPSVDPADSKSLDNHHALALAGIAILENLELSRAEQGEYELIALPLRIPGADATWVRAVLRRLA